MVDLTKELEYRYERNEDAFEQGKIAEKWYLKNALFFQGVARLIEGEREANLMRADVTQDKFISSLKRELDSYNLTIITTAHGEARVVKQSADIKILSFLHAKKEWIHEMMLNVSVNCTEDTGPVLERLVGIETIAHKVEQNQNYYRING